MTDVIVPTAEKRDDAREDLEDDEVLVFQQTDSSLPGGGGVAHASFYNPDAAQDAAPRTSIELRAFIFYM